MRYFFESEFSYFQLLAISMLLNTVIWYVFAFSSIPLCSDACVMCPFFCHPHGHPCLVIPPCLSISPVIAPVLSNQGVCSLSFPGIFGRTSPTTASLGIQVSFFLLVVVGRSPPVTALLGSRISFFLMVSVLCHLHRHKSLLAMEML